MNDIYVKWQKWKPVISVVMSSCWLIFMTPYYNLQKQEQQITIHNTKITL